MKNFHHVKKDTRIYWEFKPGHVKERTKDKNGKTKISLFAQGIGGYTNTATTSPADIFLATEHVTAVSKIVLEAQESFYKDFHGLVNEKISDMFVTHWKSLCRAEGKEELYKKRKQQFDYFLAEITKAKQVIKLFKVLGVPFIEVE